MPTTAEELGTRTQDTHCARVSIGQTGDPLYVGDSFERLYTWLDETGLINFSSYVPTADILDESGLVVGTGTVTPDPGDVTGAFQVVFTNAETVVGLVGVATHWRLRITSGAVTRTLIKALFTLQA